MKQEYNIAWKLQNKIVGRQLAVRREEYEDMLRQTMSESTEAAHFNTTYIANCKSEIQRSVGRSAHIWRRL